MKALSTAVEMQGESADRLHGEAFVAFIERRWEAMDTLAKCMFAARSFWEVSAMRRTDRELNLPRSRAGSSMLHRGRWQDVRP